MSRSEIIGYCVSGAITLASILANLIASHKKGKKAKISEIIANIASYVIQAEHIFGKGFGPAKMQWVLTKVQIDCVEANVKIDEAVVRSEVENILEAPQKKAIEVSNEETARADVQE